MTHAELRVKAAELRLKWAAWAREHPEEHARALAELRSLARDLAAGLRRQGWRGENQDRWREKRSRVPASKAQPTFSNQIVAEMFEAKHHAGELRVLKRTDGLYIVYDHRKSVAEAKVAGPFVSLLAADAAMRARAAGERGSK